MQQVIKIMSYLWSINTCLSGIWLMNSSDDFFYLFFLSIPSGIFIISQFKGACSNPQTHTPFFSKPMEIFISRVESHNGGGGGGTQIWFGQECAAQSSTPFILPKNVPISKDFSQNIDLLFIIIVQNFGCQTPKILNILEKWTHV